MDSNNIIPEAARERLAGFATSCGAEPETCSAEGALVRLRLGPGHMDGRGQVHRGLLCTLMETAAGVAADCAVPGRRAAALCSAEFSFFFPPGGTVLRARGRVVRAGRSMCLVRAELLDAGDRVCAAGAFEYACSDAS